MKTASTFLKNFLNSAQHFYVADLYTFTLTDGTVLSYANSTADVRLPANLVINSTQIDLFSNTRSSDLANVIIAPDGGLSGDKIIEDATAANTHFCFQSNLAVPAAVAPFTGSIYAKQGSRTWLALQLFEMTGSTAITGYFDLANGVIGGTTGHGANWDTCTPRMVAGGNGWWRCSVSGTKTNAATLLQLRPLLATGNNAITYDGDGTSNLYLWGAAVDTTAAATAYVGTGATPIASRSFDSQSILIKRGPVRTVIGVEVDTLELTVSALQSHLIGSTPWLQAVRQGALDGATLLVERLIMPTPGDYSLGTYTVFSGRVADIEFGRFSAMIKVNSDLELLNVQMPRNVYQPGCLNTLFDSSCTLSKAAFAVAGTIQAGSDSVKLVTNLSNPVGWFASGTITFTSGALAGVSMGIKDHPSIGRLSLYAPATSLPAPGDTFNAYPGCPKTQSACANTAASAPPFNNLPHFRGFPYVPAPETIM